MDRCDDGSHEFSAQPRTGPRRQRPHRQERHSMSRGGVGARRGLLRLALGGHRAAPFDVRQVPAGRLPDALTCRAPNRRQKRVSLSVVKFFSPACATTTSTEKRPPKNLSHRRAVAAPPSRPPLLPHSAIVRSPSHPAWCPPRLRPRRLSHLGSPMARFLGTLRARERHAMRAKTALTSDSTRATGQATSTAPSARARTAPWR